MTNSQMDVFGPGFIPGKVRVSRDATSRALRRDYSGVPEPNEVEQADDQSRGAASQPESKA